MYDYRRERPKLFTEEGQRKFLQVRDQAKRLMQGSGAIRYDALTAGICGDSWETLACVDRMVELGEIRQLRDDGRATQHQFYIRADQ